MSYCQAPPLACSYPHCTCGIPRPRGIRSRRRRSSTPARAFWYDAFRQLRILRREHAKAAMDALLFGTGVVRTNTRTGEVQHVPIEHVTNDMLENPSAHVYLPPRT